MRLWKLVDIACSPLLTVASIVGALYKQNVDFWISCTLQRKYGNGNCSFVYRWKFSMLSNAAKRCSNYHFSRSVWRGKHRVRCFCFTSIRIFRSDNTLGTNVVFKSTLFAFRLRSIKFNDSSLIDISQWLMSSTVDFRLVNFSSIGVNHKICLNSTNIPEPNYPLPNMFFMFHICCYFA